MFYKYYITLLKFRFKTRYLWHLEWQVVKVKKCFDCSNIAHCLLLSTNTAVLQKQCSVSCSFLFILVSSQIPPWMLETGAVHLLPHSPCLPYSPCFLRTRSHLLTSDSSFKIQKYFHRKDLVGFGRPTLFSLMLGSHWTNLTKIWCKHCQIETAP